MAEVVEDLARDSEVVQDLVAILITITDMNPSRSAEAVALLSDQLIERKPPFYFPQGGKISSPFPSSLLG